ncbi:recombinase [Solitalea longa]|uniref:Recombinase n=1 Tax=Solitalea longa TaxID=2079460 RepID=A0A2S5A2Y5_9SPHI|nr:site-specific integrase [Solitalea longa]POY36473.1 recombinase [Solitalea longa]
MRYRLSILFFVKRSKTTKEGLIPIYLRVTIEGQRIEISTKRYVHESKWSVDSGRMKGHSEEARSINSYLDLLRGKVYDYQQELIREGKPITVDLMRNKLLGTDGKQRSLIKIFQDHNNRMEDLVGDEFAPGTLERYKTALKHTVDFLDWKFNVSDMDIRNVDHAFITEYEFYLRSVCKCSNNTAVKYIKNFGKIIRICIANGWLDRNPFVNYKAKVKEVERVYLSEEELQGLMKKDFRNERLDLVRDIFLFSCFTGLAYVDVKKLTLHNISTGIDGEKWIFTHRTKTETPSNIPLLPSSLAIIDKYKNNPQAINKGCLFPILSNQKMNAYLKEIAALSGIEKELTFHIARHTFATTVTLNNNVPIESVSKMLGHKNLRTTQHYAKILDKKVSEDMKALKEKFSLKANSRKSKLG